MNAADAWNARYPVGTPVRYWPMDRTGPGVVSRTRTPAWTVAHGAALVSVEGRSGGISLTHVEPITEEDHQMSRQARPCGTTAAYQRHHKRGEELYRALLAEEIGKETGGV